MKKITYMTLIAAIAGSALFANQIRVQSSTELPANCRHIADVKVGDIALGKAKTEVSDGLEKAALELGGNFVLTDIKRVNHPKSGVYYWGWGTVAQCR